MLAPRRLLFAAAGGHGHLQPLLPLAEHAAAAGHQVLVTGAAALAPHAARRGLRYAASGPDLSPVHAPLMVHDVDQERRAVGTHFVARLGRVRAGDVLDLCRSWRPDVVVRDEVDFGTAIAAEAAGVPHAVVVVLGAGGFLRPEILRRPLDALAAELGLDTGDSVALLGRHLVLTPFPSRFRDPSDPLLGSVVAYRLPVSAPGTGSGRGRAAYVTLGTIFNTESGDLLRTMALGAAACEGMDRVVVATGEHLDPAVLLPLPGNVVAERFVQQDAALAQCDVIVSHAGSGTVLGALRHGLPTVSLPLGADQHLNARRLDQLGLGVTLPADAASSADVRVAVAIALSSDSMMREARVMRDEIRSLPALDRALSALVRLVEQPGGSVGVHGRAAPHGVAAGGAGPRAAGPAGRGQ